MKVELVIFDMDGLMFDSEKPCFEGWSRALTEMGYEPDVNTYIKSIGTGSKEAEEFYKGKYGQDLDFQALSAKTKQYKDEIVLKEGLRIKKGVIELIAYLDSVHIKKAIASSSSRAAIHRNLESTGIENNFDYIISGAELKRTKPDPEIFVKVCEDLGIDRAHAIVLEDSLNGIRAAYTGGIKCIVVPDMVPVNDEIKEKAFRIENSLLEVKDFLINNI